jgi:hypothetical protein
LSVFKADNEVLVNYVPNVVLNVFKPDIERVKSIRGCQVNKNKTKFQKRKKWRSKIGKVYYYDYYYDYYYYYYYYYYVLLQRLLP